MSRELSLPTFFIPRTDAIHRRNRGPFYLLLLVPLGGWVFQIHGQGWFHGHQPRAGFHCHAYVDPD